MRARILGLFVLALGLAAAPIVDAQRRKPKPNPDTVDVSKYRDKMVVIHDGDGHYVIAVPAMGHYTTVFYGDGKVFYKQRTFGGGMDGGNKSMSASFWAPRTDHVSRVEQTKGKWSVTCGKRETSMTELDAAATKKMLGGADFRKPKWKYQAYKLARDDRGNYYYVDRLRDEFGGKGYRMWIGPRGRMKKQRMTNIVSDSEGDIFATRDGALRFITKPKSSIWVKGKNRSELTNVPPIKNVKLIYGDLGVYLGDLGTPCDHL